MLGHGRIGREWQREGSDTIAEDSVAGFNKENIGKTDAKTI